MTNDLIIRALESAGYVDVEPTEENLVSCFKDYVSEGIWRNLELDENGDVWDECGDQITDPQMMAKALIRL